MEKEGFGEEFSICPSFCFGEIRGGQKTEKRIRYCASTILLFLIVRDYGVHPRHSPRTFPLGLLAPRCLGLAHFLAIARLRAGGSGARLFGGRKESFPQLRLGSCSASLRIPQSGTGLTQPARTTPFLVFISALCGVAFATRFLYCKITAALIL